MRLYVLDKQYLVRDGKVQIIDEYTGRPCQTAPGRGGFTSS
jgi:preprotein translocase subunit SecA